MINKKIIIFADNFVGKELVKYLLDYFKSHISVIITFDSNEITKIAKKSKIPTFVFENNKHLLENLSQDFDLGFLLWWPTILKKDTLALSKGGFYNIHPSFLPYSKGKNPNFWALKNQDPFGVTIHKVNTEIDSGEIIAQKRISYSWLDNGGTIYKKAQKECIKLFKNIFPHIFNQSIKNYKPNPKSNINFKKDMCKESEIKLDKKYKARDLLNLIRARTFTGKPGCWFIDEEKKYEVRIKINRIQ